MYHGGCHGCKHAYGNHNASNICPSCRYMEADWWKPNLNTKELMKLKLYHKDVPYNTLWKILGFIVHICTGWMLWNTHYEVFFSRYNWINRKRILDWMEEHGVPTPEQRWGGYRFVLDDYELSVNENQWTCFTKDSRTCVLSSFQGDKRARKDYGAIKWILDMKIDDFERLINTDDFKENDEYLERLGCE